MIQPQVEVKEKQEEFEVLRCIFTGNVLSTMHSMYLDAIPKLWSLNKVLNGLSYSMATSPLFWQVLSSVKIVQCYCMAYQACCF